ncbi:CBS domain-containing protein [Devosia nitrariae]|uniref:CBS domain-containing protein n=1 Tax=Devosia nitrariae TaxID=2071872 RepID=A0ABQ5WC37_9HYPH|nr:CBS domain-containing protein [Devosia nitrariae]GLQ57070.1 CBS domain-containing protein [Devosia nitrariae]
MIIADLIGATRTRFRALSHASSVQAAADAFSDARLGLIIVCDAADRATGVVSKSDLVRHLARSGRTDMPVTAVMTNSVLSASPSDDLRTTWEFMVARRLQSLPLLDPGRRPLGTLDIRDALEAILAFEQDQEDQLVNYIAGKGYR